MWRIWFGMLVVHEALIADGATSAELLLAAKSPYLLERLVASRRSFAWGDYWKSLGLKDQPFVSPCGDDPSKVLRCDVELLVVTEPFQVLATVVGSNDSSRIYLRFQNSGSVERPGIWTFAGLQEQFVRNYPPTAGIRRVGWRPFLVFRKQGFYGSDWSTEMEAWHDLSSPDFKAVVNVVVRNHFSGFPDGVQMEVETHSGLTPVMRGSEFDLVLDSQASFLHGETFATRKSRMVFTRRGDRFELNQKLSDTSLEDYDRYFAFGEKTPDAEALLRYLLPEFSAIARKPGTKIYYWLKRYLSEAKDTPARRSLVALMR
jgi:hypothetical protein